MCNQQALCFLSITDTHKLSITDLWEQTLLLLTELPVLLRESFHVAEREEVLMHLCSVSTLPLPLSPRNLHLFAFLFALQFPYDRGTFDCQCVVTQSPFFFFYVTGPCGTIMPLYKEKKQLKNQQQ